MSVQIPPKPLTVTEFTRRVKGLIETSFRAVWIEGEISNLRTPGSGHVYFTLKDANAQLATVMFRSIAVGVNFKLRDGLAVIIHGDVSVYERQGQYQVIVRQLLPKGLGALQLAFEELKRKLLAEGLFEAARKKPIPVLPQHIGLVTSPSGAAIRDFLNIIDRRFRNVHVVIYPVRVQGAGAAQEIAAAIDHFNALHAARTLCLDVLIVTRGGGSLEDLWSFNEEIVARALFRSTIPTISAVGHEIDFTISDFVADLRAPTPSAAAELVVKAKNEFEANLRDFGQRLAKDLRWRMGELRNRYRELATSYVFRQPAELVRQYQQRVDDHRYRLAQAVESELVHQRSRVNLVSSKFRLLSPQAMVAGWRRTLDARTHRFHAAREKARQRFGHRLDTARVRLELLSPNATLKRGYSITLATETRKLIRSVNDVAPGLSITTRVADGEFESKVRKDERAT